MNPKYEIDLKKEKKFFETRVTEYSDGRGVELALSGEEKKRAIGGDGALYGALRQGRACPPSRHSKT